MEEIIVAVVEIKTTLQIMPSDIGYGEEGMGGSNMPAEQEQANMEYVKDFLESLTPEELTFAKAELDRMMSGMAENPEADNILID